MLIVAVVCQFRVIIIKTASCEFSFKQDGQDFTLSNITGDMFTIMTAKAQAIIITPTVCDAVCLLITAQKISGVTYAYDGNVSFGRPAW